jgi:DNA-binding CsgD family transcriptional regulator
VTGLGRDAVAALVEEKTGVSVSAAVVETLAVQTRGNPLALAELCGLLGPDQLSGRSPLPDPLPVASAIVTEFVDRVRLLPVSARTALLIAATAGGADLATMVRAGDHLGVTIEDLDAAERAGLVSVRNGAIALRHPLVRSAAYHAATFAERRAAHLALADALPDGDDERRAWHLAAAALGPDAEVADRLEQVAVRARQRGAHASAAVAFERAAELTDDREQRVRRRLAGVNSARAAGLTERALGALEAIELESSDTRTQAEVIAIRAKITVGWDPQGTGVAGLIAAADLLAPFDPRRAAGLLFLASAAGAYAGQRDDLEAIADRAMALDLPPDAATVRYLRAFSSAMHERDEAGGDTLASFAEADELGVEASIADAIRSHAYLDPRRDDGGLDALRFAALNVESRRMARPDELPSWLVLLSFREFQAGNWPAARASGTEALDLAHEMRHDGWERGAANILALVAAAQGRFDEVERLLAPWVHSVGRSHGTPGISAAWAFGLGKLGAGRADEALSLLELAYDNKWADVGFISRHLIADLVQAAVQAGRAEVGEVALAQFERWPGAAAGVIDRARAAHAHGLLRDGDEAERWLRSALALHDGTVRPFERARAELALGEVLRRARRRSEAREPLRAALQEFERLGTEPWTERARGELRATGESFHRRDPTALETLTPQEFQVARFVAAGGTNREVGAQLFLSHRTVSFHLHNVYRKLGVASRTELARIDFERGLETPVG